VNLPDERAVPPGAGDLASAKSPLVVTTFGVTDPGSVRPSNEDQFLIAELRKAMRVRQSSLTQPANQYSDERGYLMVVADGMGGRRGGERASALAVDTIERFSLNTLKWFFHLRGPEEKNVLGEFQAALRQADLRVSEESEDHPEMSGMGTTLTMAYALNSELYVVHVGDSRCYVLRGGELKQLTQDHTVVAELIRQGQLAPEAATRHRLRHMITNVVGGGKPGVHVEVQKLQLEPNDVVLLCTDGLTQTLSDDRITDILRSEPNPEEACTRLVAAANEAGASDNVSAIVARFTSPS
jgi:PPM family protein phosphatase